MVKESNIKYRVAYCENEFFVTGNFNQGRRPHHVGAGLASGRNSVRSARL